MKTPRRKRPNINDEAVVKYAAEKLLPDMINWLGEDDEAESEILEDLIKAIQYADDGYEIAKRLDGNYSPDAALVDILDRASSYKRSALQSLCTEWVISEELEAPQIGSHVTHIRYNDAIGTVVRNCSDGRSTVAFPTLGHVNEGNGCHGFILEWESLIGLPNENQQSNESASIKTNL